MQEKIIKLKNKIEKNILNSEAKINGHFDDNGNIHSVNISVSSPVFKNLTLLEQHKEVLAAIKTDMEHIHAVSIKTKAL